VTKARRGWGEGGVYRRTSDGLWVGTIELGRDHRGHRRRRAVYGRTKREALVKLEKARRDTDQNLQPVDLRLTTGEWLDRWLSDHADELSPGSLATYKYAVEGCIKPEVGQIRLAKLTPSNVERMGRALRVRGLSAGTAKLAHRVLRAALSVAERHGVVHRNVAAIAAGPKRDDRAKTDDTLSAEHSAAVIAAAEGDRVGALATLLLSLGLRKGEALALRWEDVVLEGPEPSVTIKATLSRVAGQGLVAGPTKTTGSEGTIPLVEPALSALRAHRKHQAAERLKAAVWVDDGIVFATPMGTWTDPRNALRIWHGWTQAAGLGKRRMHASRHTCATVMLANGVPLEVVSAVLRHSSLRMTADAYARVAADAKRKALSATTPSSG
jgi:integrase